jgi:hypothetical protein
MVSYEEYALIKLVVSAAKRLPDMRADFVKALRSEASEAGGQSGPWPLALAFLDAANEIEAMDRQRCAEHPERPAIAFEPVFEMWVCQECKDRYEKMDDQSVDYE